MKKLNYLLFGSPLLLLASCAQTDVNNSEPQKEISVNFRVNLPKEFSTRSLGDGLSATDLAVIVYAKDGSDYNYVLSSDATFENDSYSTTVTFDLVSGNDYNVIFFAQSSQSENVYTIDTATGVLTADYSSMTSAANLADAYDCFYNTYSISAMTGGNVTASVELKRPVAQINWGTTEITDDSVTNFDDIFGNNGAYLQTTLSTTAYTTLNLLTGEYGNQESIELSNFGAPSSTDGTFPVSGYQYIAVQYILAPAASSEVAELVLQINNKGGNNTSGDFSKTLTVSNAPVQANYQTNVYGALLTASAAVTVDKQSGTWSGSYDKSLIWDGTTVTYPTVDDQAKTANVAQPSDLAGLAKMVNGTADDSSTPNTFEGYTITLAADMDMGGNTFEGIGSASRSGSGLGSGTNSFKGVFDGQNHTISNVKIQGTSNENDCIGIFPSIDGAGAAVKNLNVSEITIDASSNHQAAVVGVMSNGATVSNVNVYSGNVTAAEGAAGVVGRVLMNGTVTGCSNNATINSGTNGGGIVGAAYYTSDGTSMTISNCTNSGSVSGTSQGIGGIAGLCAAEVTGCTNNGTITGGTTATGGIVGQQNCAGNVTNCTNNGKVVGGSGYGSGGIVGWVRYNGTTTNYARQNIITVMQCKNTASVTGSTGVGGIVGVWYMCGICNQNTNTAPSLSATGQFVAGIVGDSQWTGEAPGTSVSGNTQMLFVQNNYSSTSLSDITGGSKAEFIYINSQNNVTATGNSTTDPDVVNSAASQS